MIYDPQTLDEAYADLDDCRYMLTLDDDELLQSGFDWGDFADEEIRLKRVIQQWEEI
jgi:hypothetical protein